MRAACVLLVAAAAFATGCFGPGCGDGGEVRIVDGPDGPPVANATLATMLAGEYRNVTTNENGEATAPDGSFTIVKEGFIPADACRGERAGVVSIAIFRSHIALTMEGELAGGDLGTNDEPSGIVPDRWHAQEVPFGASPHARREYAARLYGINATLTWNNTLLGGAGDLALGLGPTSEEALLWHDSDTTQVEQGEHREILRATLREFDQRWEGATTLYAGAGAGKAYASPTGIPYRLDLEAYFGHPHGTPSISPAALLVAIAAVALIITRRSGQ